jgi:undecaprenyl-diphosphatase
VDSAISLGVHGLVVAQPWLASLAASVADYGVFVLPVALVVVWFARGQSQVVRRRAVLAGCLAAVVAMCVGLVLERTLARPRPFVALGIAPLIPHAADSSFPSDHTLVGVALVGPLAWRAPRVGLWLLGWALLVGAARVLAALHYPSDITGSALLALALAGLAWPVVARLVEALPEAIRRRLALQSASPGAHAGAKR